MPSRFSWGRLARSLGGRREGRVRESSRLTPAEKKEGTGVAGKVLSQKEFAGGCKERAGKSSGGTYSGDWEPESSMSHSALSWGRREGKKKRARGVLPLGGEMSVLPFG